MPVRDKTEPEAYCDVCNLDGAATCAICGGVFCGNHCVPMQFERAGWRLHRRVCKKCMGKPVGLDEIIRGNEPSSWRGPEQGQPGLADFISFQIDEMP